MLYENNMINYHISKISSIKSEEKTIFESKISITKE